MKKMQFFIIDFTVTFAFVTIYSAMKPKIKQKANRNRENPAAVC